MFTGIITDVGKIAGVHPRGDVRRIAIDSSYDAASIDVGASIACAGVCLTVVSRSATNTGCRFDVEAAPETLAVSTAADWKEGMRLNLERALKVGDELGGHIVSGHVDGIATLMERRDGPETTLMAFDAPASLARFIAVKGSVALDGTSLTVNRVDGSRFECLIIPHTLAVTTWGERKPGDRINLEVDTMARYAARLAEAP